MLWRTGNFSISGPGSAYQLPTQLRSWFYSIFCSIRRSKNRAVTWLISSVVHTLQSLPSQRITGFVRKKIMSIRKRWK